MIQDRVSKTSPCSWFLPSIFLFFVPRTWDVKLRVPAKVVYNPLIGGPYLWGWGGGIALNFPWWQWQVSCELFVPHSVGKKPYSFCVEWIRCLSNPKPPVPWAARFFFGREPGETHSVIKWDPFWRGEKSKKQQMYGWIYGREFPVNDDAWFGSLSYIVTHGTCGNIFLGP